MNRAGAYLAKHSIRQACEALASSRQKHLAPPAPSQDLEEGFATSAA